MPDNERLPAAHAISPLFDGAFSAPADTSSASSLVHKTGMREKAKILLVDDDEATLLALSDALRLRLRDALIVTAESSDTAVEQLRLHQYGVIISDIVMPGRDGLAFLNEVQQLRPEIPVVLVSGHPGHEEAAFYAGAYAFLDKPFNMNHLVAIVRSALDRSHLQRRIRERTKASVPNLPTALFPSAEHFLHR